MTVAALSATAHEYGIGQPPASKQGLIDVLQALRDTDGFDEDRFADVLAKKTYLPDIQPVVSHLPQELRE